MSWEVSNRRARAFRAAIGATVESLESRRLFALPQVSIAATDPTASEAGLDTGTYRITRSGDLSASLVVNLIVGGRATNGVDYGTIGNAITLAAGQSTFDFLVRPASDTKVEPTESITVSLGASSAYTINPDAPLGNVLLKDGGGATLAEIGFFKANINFQPYDVPVPAGYIVDGGSSYKRQSNGRTYGWSASKTLDTRDRDASNAYDQRYDTFIHTGDAAWNMAVPNGTYLVHLVAGDPENFDSTYNFIVEGNELISGKPNAGNRFLEGTETVTVTDGTITISNGSGAANNKLMFANITQLTDAAGRELGVPLVSFADAHADAAEPNDPGIWHVRRIGSTAQALTVKYTVGGSATNGKDYETLTGTLTIPAGEDEVELRIDTIDDSQIESRELVTVSLVDSAGYLTGGDTDAVCTIQSNDVLTPHVSWATNNAPKPDLGRVEAGILQIGSKLYVIGGFRENLTITSRVDVLDFSTGKWTSLAPLPSGAARTHGAVATDGKFIYLVSGQPGEGYSAGTTKAFKYDIANNQWSSFVSLPSTRFASTMFYIGGKLHLVGGTSSDRATPQDDHWLIDPNAANPKWESASSMPKAQDHIAHAVIGDDVYIVGGEHGHASIADPHAATYVQHKYLFKYDDKTDTWTRLADMPKAASHFEGAIQVINGKIVVFGGKAGNDDQTGTVQVYDPATNKWRVISNAIPDGREGAATAVWQGKIWYGLGFSEQLEVTTKSYWGTLEDF
jgi:N-acetylneuraminic acid mutarotase